MSNLGQAREGVSVFVLAARVDRDEFARYLQCLDAALAAAKPFAMIVDGSDPELQLVEQPNKRWQLSRAIGIGKHHHGVAFVTGTMTRDRLQVLTALQPQGVPYAYFGNHGEALDWAHSALDERKAALGERATVSLMAVR